MKRHHVELAEATGRLWARCRCGWRGTSYELHALDRQAVIQAAERDAREHETNERGGNR
ncbi:MAG: hypothetical protein ACRDYA_05915 [Egibacteraceae bacterium]